MLKSYNIVIQKVIHETSDSVSIELEIPNDLKENFAFRAGQHLALKHQVNGEELRRNYSLCSRPDQGWKIAIKQIPGGRFSTFAKQKLQEGDVLQVMPPTGHFTMDFSGENKNLYVAFAAGSGITPVLSLMKEGLHKEPNSRFILIYGNKRKETMLFRDELAGLKNRYVDRLSLFHVFSEENLGSDLQEGRINAEKCEKFVKTIFNTNEVDQFLLCGPEEMIFSVKEELERLGVSSSKIKFELFTTEGLKNRQAIAEKKNVPEKKKVKSAVRVNRDGNSFSFDLYSTDISVLDAAVAAGADLPFSCKGGVCSTCKARLVEGEVEMDVNYALEPDELEAGYILTCQSHPRSEKLVIDFDQ